MALGKTALGAVFFGLPLALFATRCFPEAPAAGGACRPATQAELDCSAPSYTPTDLKDANQDGYICTGGARPDTQSTYVEGIPRGLLCSNRGLLSGGALGEAGAPADLEADAVGFCCTPEPVPCAYDPASDCEVPSDGYQCWGANRPESLNPTVSCSNGYRELDNSEIINYCCNPLGVTPDCAQVDRAGCSERMLGFECKGDSMPRGENLGPNKSRADFFHPLCTLQVTQPANQSLKHYCCYMPALPPIGGTCVGHISVPGCDRGRFGFACYGPDRPEENYLPMTCGDGFEGTSAEGYPATLYCCDFN